MSGIELIVPWRGGCRYRESNWDFLRRQHRHPIRMAPAPAGPWNKARAVVAALEASDAEIVIVADADCWTDGLDRAVEAVRAGADWAIPHRVVLRLTEPATVRFIAGAAADGLALEERRYVGTAGGGFVVARRRTLLDVPPDPRFEGWGGEDESWGWALLGLLGAPWRPKDVAPLIHLWHPAQVRQDRRWGSAKSRRLSRRYHLARHDPTALRALIVEGRQIDTDGGTADDDLHDHPA